MLWERPVALAAGVGEDRYWWQAVGLLVTLDYCLIGGADVWVIWRNLGQG